VQPVLARVAKHDIRAALGVSEPYASRIQASEIIPHPRRWAALGELAGISLSTGEVSKIKQNRIRLPERHFRP